MRLQIIGLILVILAILLKIFPYLMKLFIVKVPPVYGAIIISKISGRTPRILKEGMHLKFPWQYAVIFSLEKSVPKEIVIDSIPTKDGGTATIKCSYQYHPSFNHLQKYIENDESMIKNGIEDMIKSFIGQFAAKHTIDEIAQKWEILENFVREKFKEEHYYYDETLNRKIKYKDLEDRYGVEIIRVSITDIDFPEEIQKRREKRLQEIYLEKSEKERWKNTLRRINQIIKKDPNKSFEKALKAIETDRGLINKQIIEIEGLPEILKKIIEGVSK